MVSLVGDMSFDFTFPSCEPATPPSYHFDPSLLEMSYHPGHARSSSYSSYCSTETSPSVSISTRATTPARSPQPIRHHGPILLPKIRSQDQAIECPPKRMKMSPAPTPKPSRRGTFRPTHTRSYTNPETLNHFSNSLYAPTESQNPMSQSLLCSPVTFAQDSMNNARRSSTVSLDSAALEKYSYPYRQMPSFIQAPTPPQNDQFFFGYVPRAPSPLSLSSTPTPDPIPSTTLMNYLTSSNPAPSLVRTISFPLRDPHTKHFWWDIRQVRPWNNFNLNTILSLPGASELLNCPIPQSLVQHPSPSARHPETEAALHSIYASYYLPKLNSALALSNQRPLQLSVPSTKASTTAPNDHLFVANLMGESSTAAAMFGGKPSARVVGLVKSFDRFNTQMRVEGNVKRVEYLRGLAHLHHTMREHGTRYGFILTEIELVVCRNGAENTPHFGFLEVTSVPLNTSTSSTSSSSADDDDDYDEEDREIPLTACLALWGLCVMASDDGVNGHGLDLDLVDGNGNGNGYVSWRAEIGAPAEGTRRKALQRDPWMPPPQLAEKREAKRARGWVFPEDPIGRKELGKRGVKYGGC
ncbi:hypothetical protein M426DRAFT_322564 [Hypoxylon sp. CI-4A]|nr:hypothetical protein M426DRAFT_322564 [Hypoxylon sp. CI-4A]